MDLNSIMAQLQALQQQVQALQGQQHAQGAPGVQPGQPVAAPAVQTPQAPALRVPPPMAAQSAPMQMQGHAAPRAPGAPMPGQDMTPSAAMSDHASMARLLEQRRMAGGG